MESLRVLVIDDEPAVRQATAEAVQRLGHTVEVAPSAEAGLELLERCDVVLCDVIMPGMDGIQFIEAALRLRPDLRIIMMSGRAEVDDVVGAWRAGAVDFVRKPTPRVELRSALSRAMGVGRAPSRMSGGASPADSDDVRPARPGLCATEVVSEGATEDAHGDAASNERVRRILAHIRKHGIVFPVPPGVVRRVAELAGQNDPDPEAVIRLLESEPLLGRTVLKLANTAEFRGMVPPATVRAAAARVGAYRALSNAASVLHRTSHRLEGDMASRFASELWLTHVLSAAVAEQLATATGVAAAHQVQMLALFANTGEPAVLQAGMATCPELFEGTTPSDELRGLLRRARGKAAEAQLARWSIGPALTGMVQSVWSRGPARPPASVVRAARVEVDRNLRPDPVGVDPGWEGAADVAPSLERGQLVGFCTRALAHARALFTIEAG